ncbi:hypothetical protein FS837_006306, partial [Tulasnella sp. UAMH 9824]
GRIISLTLESLVASERHKQEIQALPENEARNSPFTTINLPCLTKVSLRWLSPSLLLPIVQSLNVSTLESLTIAHQISAEDPGEAGDPFASFVATMIASTHRVTVDLRSATVTLRSRSDATCQYTVELQGEYSVIIPWLRFRLFSQITEEYSTELQISSYGLGDNPSQGVLDDLMRFPKVESVALEGSVESWRWIWLLSLPDAVQPGSGYYERRPATWLWPSLRQLTFHGDYVNEFTILSVLLARYGPPSKGRPTAKNGALPHRLAMLEA